jgi:PRTRC genetic system ThiF family protein
MTKTKQEDQVAPTVHVLPSPLLSKTVVVDLVGVGGTGSQMLTGLARLHLALIALGHPHGLHVRAYDPDCVSESNIGRQLFAPSDVGRSKADILIHRLNCWFGLNWTAHVERYAPTISRNWSDDLRNADIVITCVDTAAARRQIATSLTAMKSAAPTYWLDCGNGQQTAQVFLTEFVEPLMAPIRSKGMGDRLAKRKDLVLPRLQDQLPEIFDEEFLEDNRPSCSLAEALEEQGLYINQHVATWALTLLERLFRDGQLTVCGYWINLLDGRVFPVPVVPVVPIAAPSGKAGRCRRGGANG